MEKSHSWLLVVARDDSWWFAIIRNYSWLWKITKFMLVCDYLLWFVVRTCGNPCRTYGHPESQTKSCPITPGHFIGVCPRAHARAGVLWCTGGLEATCRQSILLYQAAISNTWMWRGRGLGIALRGGRHHPGLTKRIHIKKGLFLSQMPSLLDSISAPRKNERNTMGTMWTENPLGAMWWLYLLAQPDSHSQQPKKIRKTIWQYSTKFWKIMTQFLKTLWHHSGKFEQNWINQKMKWKMNGI